MFDLNVTFMTYNVQINTVKLLCFKKMPLWKRFRVSRRSVERLRRRLQGVEFHELHACPAEKKDRKQWQKLRYINAVFTFESDKQVRPDVHM